jgi:hypothetical protein
MPSSAAASLQQDTVNTTGEIIFAMQVLGHSGVGQPRLNFFWL